MVERPRILFITGGAVDADPIAAALRAAGLDPALQPTVPADLASVADVAGVLVADADRVATLPEFITALRRSGSSLPMVLVATDPRGPAVVAALTSGASECLASTSPTRSVAEHVAARASAYRAATAPAAAAVETAPASAAPAAAPVPAAEPPPAEPVADVAGVAAPSGAGTGGPEAGEPGRALWVVCGPRGGVGRTLIAANLAVLAQEGRRVALVDNVPRFGSILLAFNLPPQTPTWVQLHGEALSEDLFDRLPRHPSGVTVLPAPSSPELADAVAPAAVNTLIHHLVMASDLVVVDQGGRLDNGGIDLMESADRLVVVGTPDNHGVYAVRTWLSICDKLRIPRSRITVMLNSVQPYHQADRERAGRVLEHPVHLLPHAGIDGVRSMSAGEPLAWKQPKSGFVKALRAVYLEMLATREVTVGAGGRTAPV
ncbi:MAG TPA: hypothetical protein VMW47_00620 [Verrucomicrobiae bacterium]|nr:hypothetical protein [Verrucomicrobiae bacterium]